MIRVRVYLLGRSPMQFDQEELDVPHREHDVHIPFSKNRLELIILQVTLFPFA